MSIVQRPIQFYGSYDSRIADYSKMDNKRTETSRLGRVLGMINFDKMFDYTPNPYVLNVEEIVAYEGRSIIKQLCTKDSADIGFSPKCDCGELDGLYYSGIVCPKCGTEVNSSFLNNLDHDVWIVLPDNFPPFIHPVWYHLLNHIPTYLKNSNVGFVDMVLNPDIEISHKYQGIVKKGFDYFHKNFDMIMAYVLDPNFHPLKYRAQIVKLSILYQKFKDCVFFRKIPLLNKILHPIIDENSQISRVDAATKHILDVIYDLSAYILAKKNGFSPNTSFNRTMYRIYKKLVEYHIYLIDKKLGKKPSLIRRHALGTRMHWTYRAVCIPICGPHSGDEIVMPWKLMVNNYKLHILNRLFKAGYNLDTAMSIHYKALLAYDPLIDSIIEELIQECPYKGIPVLLGRNPTLKLFAIQLLFIRKFKKDPHDETLEVSPLILENPNIDFDGDALWGIFLNEMDAVQDFMVLHPRESMLDVASPFVSPSVSLSDQTAIHLHRFLWDSPIYDPIVVSNDQEVSK